MTATNNNNDAAEDTRSWYDEEVHAQEEQRSSNNKDDNNDKILQSVVRVTLAGFCGALVGLARQDALAGSKIFQRSVAAGKPLARVPPKLKTVATPEDQINIPWMWAASFMVFVSLLETSRFWSPTGLALQLLYQDVAADDSDTDTDQDLPTTTSLSQQQLHQQPWNDPRYMVTVSDFTLGGAVAGWAGAMSKRQPLKSSSTSRLELPQAILKTGRKSILLSGIGTGIALGFLLGACQASLDMAEEYVAIEQQQQQETVTQPLEEDEGEGHEPPK